ncbi:MAG: hypothetical protein KDB22_23845 [Planctomycetales bacterium]|nr:hypothetical protein [Planctomycetales bacterium]
MWNTWLSGSALPALEQVAAFSEKRHALLAGNIANLDTPGYKTRDLSVQNFQQSLQSAVASAKHASHGDATANGVESVEAMEKVRDVSKQILYHDGSDVSLEEQVTEISKNQGMHSMAISLMRSQFRTLQVAIQESAAV